MSRQTSDIRMNHFSTKGYDIKFIFITNNNWQILNPEICIHLLTQCRGGVAVNVGEFDRTVSPTAAFLKKFLGLHEFVTLDTYRSVLAEFFGTFYLCFLLFGINHFQPKKNKYYKLK